MKLWLAGLTAWLCLAAAPARASGAEGGFAHWAAVIVAGDDEAAHVDVPTKAFDNARRALDREFVRRGFTAGDIAQFSVQPGAGVGPATLGAVAAGLKQMAAQAPAGCLFYLTSHGSPDGAVLGERLLTPAEAERLIAAACPGRPVVAVISACFSGVFVPALAGPNRMVMTAARRDRSSFGCGEADRYPYFDGCVLAALPTAVDFADLARRARACVARRERQTGMSPPSDPQTFIGARFAAPAFAK